MAYYKVITYSDVLEVTKYEKHPYTGRRVKTKASRATGVLDFSFGGQDDESSVQHEAIRTEANARRAGVSFRRLVAANLSVTDLPVLATFTYRDNIQEFGQGRKDWTAFVRNAERVFGEAFRYIAVPEFQKRGAIHFHALMWGLPAGTVERERSTRLVATLWGKGFADLIKTDGNHRIAGYLTKYMKKAFLHGSLPVGRHAYTASKNVKRPLVDSDAILAAYMYPENRLSPERLVLRYEYDTTRLGRADYQLYKDIPYESRSDVQK